MKRPPMDLREQFLTEYKDASVFAANARLLQSIYRVEMNLPIERRIIVLNGKKQERIFGNYIDFAYAKETFANFISENTKRVVKLEIEANKNRVGNEIKQINEKRLYGNLLSSQPLAFNLFSELSLNISLANRVFKSLFKDRSITIISIDFEFSPGRGNSKYTFDHSAFDVFVKYKVESGFGFIGFEIKYSEALKDFPAKYKPRYGEIASLSGIFTQKGIEKLTRMPVSIEQIWRDHLLALAMLPPINSEYVEGFFAYLYPSENNECRVALDKYFTMLISANPSEVGIYPIIMEEFVRIIKENTNDQWIQDFSDRYLSFDKIQDYIKPKFNTGF